MPPSNPKITIVWMPPDRNDRNDTVAPKNTIAASNQGRDHSIVYCI